MRLNGQNSQAPGGGAEGQRTSGRSFLKRNLHMNAVSRFSRLSSPAGTGGRVSVLPALAAWAFFAS